MAVKLSPVFNDAQLGTADGKPLSGGLLTWYISRTNTLVQTYSEATGSTLQSNPIVLNVRGEPDHPIWLTTNQNYTGVLTDSVGNFVRQFDDIAGVNDTATPTISEWVLLASTASYINATQFSVVGDQTAIFTAQRRLKNIVSGGQSYSTISTSGYATGITTVTVVNDSVVLDAGLSAVYYGFLDPAHPSFDSSGINAATKSAIQNQSFQAFTTAGTSTAYTLTPTPAISAYTANQRFNVIFNATSGAAPTLQVSGVATPPLLKQYNAAGVKVMAVVYIHQIADVQFDGTDWVVLDEISLSTGTGNSVLDTGATITSPIFAGTPGGVGVLTSMSATPVSASGTAVTFSGIPAWAKRVTIMLDGISLVSTGIPMLRLGVAGGPEVTGYTGIVSVIGTGVSVRATSTAGFELLTASAAAFLIKGTITLTHIGSNIWCVNSMVGDAVSTYLFLSTGSKPLAGALTQIVLTTAAGTDTFDAGTINVMYD
jgi:hypothetical protein